MTRRNPPPSDASATAAEWFVALDANAPDEIADARFASWLDRAAENESDLERCEAAVEIARGLANDPELRWAYDEAAALATGGLTRKPRRPRMFERFAGAKVAWGIAAVALVGVVAALIVGEVRAPSGGARATAGANESEPTSHAAGLVALTLGADPAIMLPGRVVVDANSVAVLPFLEVADSTAAAPRANVATELQRDLVAALRAIPGLYVIGESSVLPYAAADLPASEIGAQLGARAVLSADVAFAADVIVVTARLLDAATDSPLWQARYEQPLDRLRSIQIEIVDGVAGALVDPELRARSARGMTQAKTPNVLAATVADAAFQ